MLTSFLYSYIRGDTQTLVPTRIRPCENKNICEWNQIPKSKKTCARTHTNNNTVCGNQKFSFAKCLILMSFTHLIVVTTSNVWFPIWNICLIFRFPNTLFWFSKTIFFRCYYYYYYYWCWLKCIKYWKSVGVWKKVVELKKMCAYIHSKHWESHCIYWNCQHYILNSKT